MPNVKQRLLNRIDTASELVLHSEDAHYAHTTRALAMKALDHIRGQLVDTGSVDVLKARLLFAPTSVLHEISMDNDWGHQFVELARDVDRLLDQLKDQV